MLDRINGTITLSPDEIRNRIRDLIRDGADREAVLGVFEGNFDVQGMVRGLIGQATFAPEPPPPPPPSQRPPQRPADRPRDTNRRATVELIELMMEHVEAIETNGEEGFNLEEFVPRVRDLIRNGADREVILEAFEGNPHAQETIGRLFGMADDAQPAIAELVTLITDEIITPGRFDNLERFVPRIRNLIRNGADRGVVFEVIGENPRAKEVVEGLFDQANAEPPPAAELGQDWRVGTLTRIIGKWVCGDLGQDREALLGLFNALIECGLTEEDIDSAKNVFYDLQMNNQNREQQDVGRRGIEMLDMIRNKFWPRRTVLLRELLTDPQQRQSLNVRNDDGETPLFIAVTRGTEENATILLECPEINVNIPNNRRLTPLHATVELGYTNMAILLIGDGRTDVNAQNAEGNTPLHLAVMQRNLEIVRALVQRQDIDVEIANTDGETAADLADRIEFWEFFGALGALGAL
jgi:hypothetical protein